MAQIIRQIKRTIRDSKVEIRRLLYIKKKILKPAAAHTFTTDLITRNTPTSIAKMGSVELSAITHYLRHAKSLSALESDQGKRACYKLYKNAGVFPISNDIFFQFCETYIDSLAQLKIITPWFRKEEAAAIKAYANNAKLIAVDPFRDFPPLRHPQHIPPWTQSLRGKTVLVIHPFTKTIRSQYPRRVDIWPDYQLLPEFTLKTITVPLADSIVPSPYPDWVAGLEDLKAQMNAIDFDVALIGAGAWSLPLTTHAEKLGGIGIHLGGGLQQVFGIKGNRWEKKGTPTYYNDAWVRPSIEETPDRAELIESACYW